MSNERLTLMNPKYSPVRIETVSRAERQKPPCRWLARRTTSSPNQKPRLQ
jgi:hypothetical protein